MTPAVHGGERRPVRTLDAAIERLERLLDVRLDWASLEQFLPPTADPEYRRSALASSFVAVLELARQGRVTLQQEAAFQPLMLRRARCRTTIFAGSRRFSLPTKGRRHVARSRTTYPAAPNYRDRLSTLSKPEREVGTATRRDG